MTTVRAKFTKVTAPKTLDASDPASPEDLCAVLFAWVTSIVIAPVFLHIRRIFFKKIATLSLRHRSSLHIVLTGSKTRNRTSESSSQSLTKASSRSRLASGANEKSTFPTMSTMYRFSMIFALITSFSSSVMFLVLSSKQTTRRRWYSSRSSSEFTITTFPGFGIAKSFFPSNGRPVAIDKASSKTNHPFPVPPGAESKANGTYARKLLTRNFRGGGGRRKKLATDAKTAVKTLRSTLQREFAGLLSIVDAHLLDQRQGFAHLFIFQQLFP